MTGKIKKIMQYDFLEYKWVVFERKVLKFWEKLTYWKKFSNFLKNQFGD